MEIELITIGTELLLGQVLDTHKQWLGQRLADRGRLLSRQLTVPDNGPAICGAVQVALGRARLVITTGGLGPTDDDLTRQLLADLMGRPLRRDASVAAQIEGFFKHRNRPMPESVLVQAQVPEGAVVFPNRHGTAPGLAIEVSPNPFRTGGELAWLILLPGPPRELRPMFDEQVLPFLEKKWPLQHDFHCRILRSLGIGESMVEETLNGLLQPLVERGLELGYCARIGQVDIRLSGSGPNVPALIEEAEVVIRAAIGKHIYGTGDETIAQAVVGRLIATGETLAVAESCTGGLLGHHITNVSGASAVFAGGVLSYSNAMKQQLLGVNPFTLSQHGAVSKPVVLEMAGGALVASGADHALSVTGIAGPDGGTLEKPVGTVWLGLASRGRRPVAVRKFNPFGREAFKHATVHQALDLLRRQLQRNSCRN
ncbi:MAG: competence/damage-inducible protein A [Verrucomicrobiota bacterium]|jgi:nicotinamide-nucleotide amidase|nr:competence/damage-inducible protein A [Verrucomicrobiota bacterium]MDP7050233.1 competence/damage-inducible protein A [Verrucomicrobiota bacterium]